MVDLTRIPTTAQLRLLESSWIKVCGHNWGLTLMEAAALGASQVALSLLEASDGSGSVAVVCGNGNNGGDGIVLARLLQRRGVNVSVHILDKPARNGSEHALNKKIFEDNVPLAFHLFDEESLDFLEAGLTRCDLIVDALLGTGLDRDVEAAYAEAIQLINDSGKQVLSIDVPSGVNSDTGQVMGVAVQADMTVTFGYLKAGLLHHPGAEYAGLISLVDIGLPNINLPPVSMYETAAELESPKWWLATHAHLRNWLPVRQPDGHKGTFGRVLTVAGSKQMTGACMLSARSVLRSGAGYSVLATASSVVDRLPAEEIVYRALSETASGGIDPKAADELKDEIELADVVLIGPGLGSEPTVAQLVDRLFKQIEKPCLIDADALNAIGSIKQFKLNTPSQCIMTPHPKELSRLLKIDVDEIQRDRIGAARKAVDMFGCTVLLKGARTVVATPDDGTYIIPTGNSGMATPGSGDVLSGVIAALLAAGMHTPHAAVAGAYLHGAAGDLAADRLGEDGMIASDIMMAVPTILAEIRDGEYEGRQIEAELLY